MLPMLAAALICADCHRDLAARFAATPMANSSGPVRAAAEHPGRVSSTYKIDGARLEWPGGAVDLAVFIGSRRMGRSYAYSQDGFLFQVPVGYYANRGAWDLAPGYERDKVPDFSRPIGADCLFCHATSSRLAPDSINRYSQVDYGIGCARCHGAGADHQQFVNPARLTGRKRDSVCDQCHLAGTARIGKAGKRLQDFQPGEDLAEYLEVFTGQSRGVRVNGHSDALAASRCKQESGGALWCGTCHDPHRAAVDYAAICRSCHAGAHRAKTRGPDCAGCHMPKSKARDGGHTVFTDHTLRLKEPDTGEIVSYFGRKPEGRDLGLGYFQIALDRRDSRYFEKAWPLLREAAARKAMDPKLYATVGALLAAAGRRREAEAYYRLSLDQDPVQPEVLHKLAALLGRGEEADRFRTRALRMLPRTF